MNFLLAVFYFTFLELQESNVRLKLTVVDSVGFGDQINKEDRSVFPLYNHFKHVYFEILTWSLKKPFLIVCSWKPIVDYIDAQFDNFLSEELKIKRSLHNYHDTRIHACLYFVAPTGHS